MRHGQSPAAPIDKNRTLSEKGMQDIARAAASLKAHNITPDHIIASDAQRTKLTAQIMAGGLGLEAENITYREALYGGSAQTYFSAIHSQSSAQSLLFVAHNPSIAELTMQIVTPDDQLKITSFAPGFMAVITCAIDSWQELKIGENQLTHFITP